MTHYGRPLFVMLWLLAAGLAAGCFPAGRAQTGIPAPAMAQAPEEQPGSWRAQYNRNRPAAPERYAVFPKQPRNNGFGEFDDALHTGMDAQPRLPDLPSDNRMPAAMIGPGIPPVDQAALYGSATTASRSGQSQTRFAAGTTAEQSPTAMTQPGIQAGSHFYPVEQLVYGGDYPDIDKPESYRLMPKDMITLTVRDHPEFSGQLEIQPDGTVGIPNAHDVVRIRGLTTDETAEKLRQTIAVYTKGPCEVRVQTNRARGGYYYVFGDVMQPGRFPMGMEPVKLSEAVLAANWEANPARRDMDGDELGPSFPAAYPRGSFQTPVTADLAAVALITPHRSQPVRTIHDVRSSLLGMTANDPIIRPGQIVVVPSLVTSRNAALGQAAVAPGFGYGSAPARLPAVDSPARYAPGNMSWIDTVPTRPEPEIESLVLPPVELNMAAAYATSQNTSRSEFQQGVTVEGPTVVHLGPGESIAQPAPVEEIMPMTGRRKVVRSGSRSGSGDGWAKGL